MKKALSLILAIVMVLSLTVPAFAEADNSTDITLTVAKVITYDMVIPEDVTDLANYGTYEVGQAKVANVKNATEKTVISYTATTTNFKSEGKTDIPASYYTDEAGQNAFPTTAVEVYKNKADAASIPTMYVSITETNWNAAENGTYKATVTFNFTSEEKAAGTPIPAGGVYQIKNGATLKGDNGDSFPESVTPNDTYTYGDYVYTYENTYIEEGRSWNAIAKDASKSSYDTPLGSVYLDIPVTLGDTFYGCYSLLTAPAIPEGITIMCNCFHDCNSLITAPVIPESVIDMESCFDGCYNLQGTIVINANPESYDYCFYDAGRDGSGIVLTGTSTMLNEIATANVNEGKVTVGGN